ncbi:cbb3-type cytochrome c oxidase subunit 3 [Glaciimonas sp. PCH181]|uniref:cbb3-type cytochrome oxidase subunit 3 n=1 Tax=Glaciimonas sp. PCH181 TaxID=2133943 RepID=UPI000D3AE751|nr:cbb3-type cytochrome c oxidase subunit 3 [Glaciimonas sp. PCH181]PUA19459.1 CcoQ/FixQ family Cbb3-type cytochrome c oxidase assembly chaperone [Glaciimonas sp. PCH181]
MAIENIFSNASIVMTVISLATFLGILGWTYCVKSSSDFDAIARLPFDDDDYEGVTLKDQTAPQTEDRHG